MSEQATIPADRSSIMKKRPPPNNNHRPNRNPKQPYHRKRHKGGTNGRIPRQQQQELPSSKPICTVCSDAEKISNYKCPKCRAIYCSVACCKEHKKICPQTPPPDMTTPIVSPPNSISGTMTCFNLPPLRSRNSGNYDDNNDDDDSLDEEWVVTDDMKRSIEKSDWLRKQLQSDGGLRDVIRQITTSRNIESIKHVQQRLPKFQIFLDKLLVVAGILERSPDNVHDDNNGQEEMEPLEEWLERDWSQDQNPPPLSLKPLRRKMPDFQPVDLPESSEDETSKDESTDSESSEDDESSDGSDST